MTGKPASQGVQLRSGSVVAIPSTASAGASSAGPYGPPAARNAVVASTTATNPERGKTRRTTNPATITAMPRPTNHGNDQAVDVSSGSGTRNGGPPCRIVMPSRRAGSSRPAAQRVLPYANAPTASARAVSTGSTCRGRVAGMSSSLGGQRSPHIGP